jgi:hypothetical protein
MAGTEKRRSTEPRNPVTMGVTATQDSTSDWRRGGAQVSIPQLMMGFTKDGQVNQPMVQDRDRRFGASTATLRKDRGDIPWPKLVPGANAWQGGKTVQMALREMPVRNLRG